MGSDASVPTAPANSPTRTRGTKLGEPLPKPLNGRQQRGDFEAEGDRHRMLQIAAPDHGRVAMAARQIGERT